MRPSKPSNSRSERQNANPASALLIRELAPRIKLPPSAIYPICVLLYKAERITGGRTINDSYFNTC